MPGSGAGRLAAAELTLKGLKGEALKAALGREFSAENLVNEGSKEDIKNEKY